MKRTYIQPLLSTKSMFGNEPLLITSFKGGLGQNGVDGGSALSRNNDSFWDDKE